MVLGSRTSDTFERYKIKYDVIPPNFNDNMISYIELYGMLMDYDDGIWQTYEEQKVLRFSDTSDNSIVDLPGFDISEYDDTIDYCSQAKEIRSKMDVLMDKDQKNGIPPVCGLPH